MAYGLGSKRQLLDRFRTERLAGGCDVVVVNGFFPGLTIKEVLDSISEGVFQHAAHFSTANDQVRVFLAQQRKLLVVVMVMPASAGGLDREPAG